MYEKFKTADRFLISIMQERSISLLRIALGVVFLWFGALKVAGVSPVADLIAETYSFLPAQSFLMVLGVWEIIIGIGLIFKIALRTTLALLWIQMLGTFGAPLMAPHIFFLGGNPLLLTVQGEFVIKNIVLITAGLVIGGWQVTPKEPHAS
ncbi:MAG: DoxX family membrane protein [Candidatus Sungbacteria bacterium]|nr:DoxX family membrane protein [Candidatus Sungbacteria bacterium]